MSSTNQNPKPAEPSANPLITPIKKDQPQTTPGNSNNPRVDPKPATAGDKR